MGSLFGAVALIIALFALWIPQKVKIKVVVDIGTIISDIPEEKRLYSITIKNIGLRAITINSIYMNFDKQSNRFFYLKTPAADRFLVSSNPSFPKRLEIGEELVFYMWKDEADKHIRKDINAKNINKHCYVYVNEVTQGKITIKTDWTVKTFIED